LEKRLAEPFSGKTVVITHMAPSARSIPDHYKDELLSAAYASHLDELAQGADLWIHGHIHDSVDYSIGNCRVISNPLGYPRSDEQGIAAQNSRFNPNFVVTV